MLRFVPYVLKGVWRHRTRAMLTITGSAVALFVFCFVESVQDGLRRLTENDAAKRTLIVFQENRFCPQTSRIPQDYQRFINKQPGVAGVTPIKVFTNNCRASLDAVVFQGLPADKLQEVRNIKLQSGDWGSYRKLDDGALVGRTVAARRNLNAGDKFTIGGVSVMVAGVFTSSNAADENVIYTHLAFLQRARGASDVGTVTQLEVRLAPEADPDAVAANIDDHFRNGPVGTSTRTKGMFQADTLSDLAELIGFIHYLGYACVGLVLALVSTTTLMSVQDRIKEHGVLQTLGLRPNHIFRLVVFESTVLTLIGGAMGIGSGIALLSLGGFAVAAEGVTIAFSPTPALAVTGAVVTLIVGMLAGLAPAWQAARTPLVVALKDG